MPDMDAVDRPNLTVFAALQNCALVRELHVYGTMLATHDKGKHLAASTEDEDA